MAHLEFSISTDTPFDTAGDTTVVLVRSGEQPQVLGDAPVTAEQLTAIGHTGASEQLAYLPTSNGASIAAVGLGSAISTDSVRNAIGSVVRRHSRGGTLRIDVPSEVSLRAAAEGARLGAYRFERFRGSASTATTPLDRVVLHSSDADADAELSRAGVIADAAALVKDLSNTPGLDMPPAALADAAVEAVAGLPITAEVWDEKRLIAEGFGGISGVGQGSSRPPRLVKLSYSPENAVRHIALVGKGITFDTGGLSLKPPASMIGMKFDMAGAATVLGSIVAAARLGAPTRLTAWLCIAENMPSSTAIRPGDVLTMKGGTTVEVLNTDAEGRLVMADGLVAASEEQPDAIIDVATLTGAAIIALGKRYTGVMGDDDLVGEVIAAATNNDEPFWHMPLPAELRSVLNSDIADLVNSKPGSPAGGMLVAGLFLREFIGSKDDGSGTLPWAHLDIAGPGDNGEAPYGFTGKGATAVALRTLVALAESPATP